MNRQTSSLPVLTGLGLRGVPTAVAEAGAGMLGSCMVCLGDFWGWVNWGDFSSLESGPELPFEDYKGKQKFNFWKFIFNVFLSVPIICVP